MLILHIHIYTRTQHAHTHTLHKMSRFTPDCVLLHRQGKIAYISPFSDYCSVIVCNISNLSKIAYVKYYPSKFGFISSFPLHFGAVRGKGTEDCEITVTATENNLG